jgi:hypothetical protein
VGPPLEEWRVSGPAWDSRLVLPIDAIFVGFRPSAGLASGDGELRLTPLQVVDEGSRVQRPPVLGGHRYGATTVFFHDDAVVGESTGFWTPGRATTQLTFASSGDAERPVNLVISCGPVANRVRLTAPQFQDDVALEPGVERPITVPTMDVPGLHARIAPLDMSIEGGFVPSDFDRASADRRLLGCRIRLP